VEEKKSLRTFAKGNSGPKFAGTAEPGLQIISCFANVSSEGSQALVLDFCLFQKSNGLILLVLFITPSYINCRLWKGNNL